MDTKYYELHVTVLPENVLEFSAFCKTIQAKPLYIQLNEGRHPDQLMLAATHMLPNDDAAKVWANDYSNMVKSHFTVTRTKLESRLVEGPNEYYEAHWKLDFKHSPEYWTCAVLDLRMMYPHLLHSRNLFDTRIHYLSQRIYDSSDHMAASTAFNSSGVKINFHGLPLVKTHYERAVWDSNPALDAGWAR
jgi:hypothetical protein